MDWAWVAIHCPNRPPFSIGRTPYPSSTRCLCDGSSRARPRAAGCRRMPYLIPHPFASPHPMPFAPPIPTPALTSCCNRNAPRSPPPLPNPRHRLESSPLRRREFHLRRRIGVQTLLQQFQLLRGRFLACPLHVR